MSQIPARDTLPTVLLVEDDESQVDLIGLYLDGFTLHVAETLEGARQQLQAHDIDLVLLDLGLPGTDGLATLKAFRSFCTDVAVVVLTGRDHDGLDMAVLRADAQDYLVKQEADEATVTRTVRHAAERFELKRERDRALEAALAQQQEVIAEQARFAALVSATPDAILRLDSEGLIREWNGSAMRILGRSAEEVVGKPFGDLCADADRDQYDGLFGRVVQGAVVPTAQVSLCASDGHYVPCSLAMVSVADSAERHVFVVARDETEKERLAHELLQSRKQEAVGVLACGIAHELNTPLQYISDAMNFSAAAVSKLQPLLDQLRTLLETSDSEELSDLRRAARSAKLNFVADNLPPAVRDGLQGVERAAAIIDAFKRFSAPRSEGMALVDINESIRCTVTVAQGRLQDVAEVSLDLAPDLPEAQVREADINQVLLQLLNNAIDAVAETEHAGLAQISIRSRCVNEQVVVCVEDEGTGIAPDVADRVFEPFYTTKPVGAGSGQGLAVAHSVVVDQHQGRLFFHNRPQGGTTFTLEIPLRAEQAPLRRASGA